jgi:hypothetical protein
MPSNLKRIVRTRMEKTGESYQQALRQIRAHLRPGCESDGVAAAEDVDAPTRDGESGDSLGAASRLIDAGEIASKIATPRTEVVNLGRIVLARMMTAARGGDVQ